MLARTLGNRFDNGSPTTLRLTADEVKNLSAASGVAYRKFGAILTSLVAPNPAPKTDDHQEAGHHARESSLA